MRQESELRVTAAVVIWGDKNMSDDTFDTPEVKAARARYVKSLEELLPEDRAALREAAKSVTPERRKEIAREATAACDSFCKALLSMQRKNR